MIMETLYFLDSNFVLTKIADDRYQNNNFSFHFDKQCVFQVIWGYVILYTTNVNSTYQDVINDNTDGIIKVILDSRYHYCFPQQLLDLVEKYSILI